MADSDITPSRPEAPPRPVSGRLLLDVLEVGAALGCGKTYVYELICLGELPVIKLGRLTRIPAASVAALVDRRLAEAAVDRGCGQPYTLIPTNLWELRPRTAPRGRRDSRPGAARSEEG